MAHGSSQIRLSVHPWLSLATFADYVQNPPVRNYLVYFARKSCLFRFVSVSPSLELADAILLVVSISRGFAFPIELVLRLGLFEEIWPHNGFYLRLLKILYV